LLTAVGLTPSGSSTVHIHTQTVRRTKQLTWEECGSCPVSASYTLAFALQLSKKHGKTSVRVVLACKKFSHLFYVYKYFFNPKFWGHERQKSVASNFIIFEKVHHFPYTVCHLTAV